MTPPKVSRSSSVVRLSHSRRKGGGTSAQARARGSPGNSTCSISSGGTGVRAGGVPHAASASRRIAAGAKRPMPLGEVLLGEFPVHQAVAEGRQVVGAPVLEVQVVGVLPHVAGEQRALPVGQRQVGVAG